MATPDLLTPLDRIVARHGSSVLADRSRLTGLLRDHAPDEIPAIRAFIGAFDLGIPGRAGSLDPASIYRESQALAASAGCQPELARLAVESWAQITARTRSLPILPLPAGALDAIQPLPGTVRSLPGAVEPYPGPVQPLPGAQGAPIVAPIPGVAMPGLQPAGAIGAGRSRPGSRMVLAGLLVLAIVVAAGWILRIMAS